MGLFVVFELKSMGGIKFKVNALNVLKKALKHKTAL